MLCEKLATEMELGTEDPMSLYKAVSDIGVYTMLLLPALLPLRKVTAVRRAVRR